MAFAATARRRLGSRLSDHLTRRLHLHLHPALPHLLAPDSSGDPRDHFPLRPPPRLQPPHFPLHQSSRTPKTLTLLPIGIHLAGPPRRSFSSSSSLPSAPALDVGTVLTESPDAVAPALASFPSEVACAAEDSSLPTAAVQHLIDAVHSSMGLNWWLSIALSTVVLRCVLFPVTIMATRGVMGMRQEILAAVELAKHIDEKSEKEAIRGLIYLFRRLGLRGFVPILKPYTFMTLYFAISNMVEKVPSLKEGGAFWFTDLTTPDDLYIFPFSCHYSEKSLYNKNVESEVNVLRTLILLTVPLTASLPQAFFCYFVTWNFTSLVYRIVMQQPTVKNLLFGDLTEPTCPPSDGSKGPTAEDPPMPIERPEQPHHTERTKASDASFHRRERTKTSDASVHRISDQSDKK